MDLTNTWESNVKLKVSYPRTVNLSAPGLVALVYWRDQNKPLCTVTCPITHTGGLNVTKHYTDLRLISGGGIAPSLLYNLWRAFPLPGRWSCSITYTGCLTDLLSSQTCSWKMVSHLDWCSWNSMCIISLKSKYAKTCHFGLAKNSQFAAGVVL